MKNEKGDKDKTIRLLRCEVVGLCIVFLLIAIVFLVKTGIISKVGATSNGKKYCVGQRNEKQVRAFVKKESLESKKDLQVFEQAKFVAKIIKVDIKEIKFPKTEVVSWEDLNGKYSFVVKITWLSKTVFEFDGEVRAYKPYAKRYANFERVSNKHYTIAADYAFIPLGSVLEVPKYSKKFNAEVRDTGPNCIGNKCEVMMSVNKNGKSAYRRAKLWGVKFTKVKVKLPKEAILHKWKWDERLRVRVGAEWGLKKLKEHGVIKSE